MSARRLLGTGLAAGPGLRVDPADVGLGTALAAAVAYLAVRWRRA